ncbi:hypothetical protein CF327_g2979 [Tilletia walkeri]|nr:hypothetical protein CF327_g2979 [Tilletia walkeri]
MRLGNKNAKTRQQAVDLVTKLAVVIRHCGEDALLSKLGVRLFEQLGEEFPEALACKISAVSGCIAKAIGPQNVLQVQLAGAGTPKSCVPYHRDCHCCRTFAFHNHPAHLTRTQDAGTQRTQREYIGEMGKDYVNTRKVREVYARIYNTTYLQAQEELVPYYPDLGELELQYRRNRCQLGTWKAGKEELSESRKRVKGRSRMRVKGESRKRVK